MSDVTELRAKYEAAGQSHVFTYWDTLSQEEKDALAQQLRAIDPARMNKVVAQALEADEAAREAKDAKVEPPPVSSMVSTVGDEESAAKYRKIGLDAIGAGQVGVLLLAGGQGTRLGSSAPKGCYDIQLPSHKSLFQLQAERISKLQQLARAHAKREDVVVPWYVMTSGPTRAPTEAFFTEHKFFGLDPANVIFFEQGTLPCISNEGKIMLDDKGKVATAPDGNGGLYAALRAPTSAGKPSVIDDLQRRGIQYLHAYGVDNCLVKVGDPVFLGVCISKKVGAGVKVVKKTDPAESVGVVARKDGAFSVVEYSEIPPALSEARGEDGELLFRAANIANHFYTTEFLANDVPSFEEKMAYHVARKKIPSVDLATGERVKPSSPNGIKLELFIFDVFPFCADLAIHEVERREEFSPLKNASGTASDNPETSRRDLLAQQRRWLQQAGASVADDVDVELSPLVTYAGEGLERAQGRTFAESGNVESL
ncbi:UDP-N-acetylglucosamine pyrophosphorylase [Malassezia pachydermatis]